MQCKHTSFTIMFSTPRVLGIPGIFSLVIPLEGSLLALSIFLEMLAAGSSGVGRDLRAFTRLCDQKLPLGLRVAQLRSAGPGANSG